MARSVGPRVDNTQSANAAFAAWPRCMDPNAPKAIRSEVSMPRSWEQICKDEANALSDASVKLLQEQLARKDAGATINDGWLDKRRGELYREALDAVGLDIVEVSA